MNNRRILEIIPLLGNGGVENMVLTWIQCLNKYSTTSFIFDIATTEILDTNKARTFEKLGCHIYVIPHRQRHMLKKYSAYKKLFEENNYAAIHLHTNCCMDFPILLAAQNAKIKIRIGHSHSSAIGTNKRLPNIMQQVTFPFFNMLCTTRLACSKEAGVHLFGRWKHTLFSNSIDTQYFSYNEANRNYIRAKYNIKPDTLLIGHVGNFVFEKNHEKLLEVFKSILEKESNTMLLLLGSGPLEKQIRNQIAQFNLSSHVILAGTRYDVEKYYSAMDAFVFTSFHEGFSIALTEAQCNGLPCFIAENLPKEMDLTDHIVRIKLDTPSEYWAEVILSILQSAKQSNRYKYSEIIKKAGYDTLDNGIRLLEYYNNEY